MSTDMIARAEAWLAAHHPDEAAAIIRDLLAEVARLTADDEWARGEGRVNIDDAPPGSLVRRLMLANTAMRRERDAARSEVARLSQPAPLTVGAALALPAARRGVAAVSVPPELRVTDADVSACLRWPTCPDCRGRSSIVDADCDRCEGWGTVGRLSSLLPRGASARIGAMIVEALPHLRHATWPPVSHMASRAEIRAMVGDIAGMGGAL